MDVMTGKEQEDISEKTSAWKSPSSAHEVPGSSVGISYQYLDTHLTHLTSPIQKKENRKRRVDTS